MPVEHSTPPVRTPDPLAGSRRRALERLGRGLRAMGLGAIGDIGSANMNRVTTTTIAWSSTSDWDNAVSESFVSHASDVVNMIPGEDSFEDLSDGTSIPSPWAGDGNYQADTSRSFDGSVAAYSNGNSAQEGLRSSEPNEAYEGEIRFIYNETTTQSGWAAGLENENGNPIIEVQTGNPQRGWHGATTYNQSDAGFSDPNPLYDAWYGYRLYNWDWTNETVDVEWFDAGGNGNTSFGESAVGFANSSTAIGGVWYGNTKLGSAGSWSVGSGSDMWFDPAYGVLSSSTLTTATKSFAASTAPDLQSLSYSLNGGGVTLDVIGSPGTASEEIVTQTLDGSTGYSLTWSNTHTDFRIRMDLSSGDRTTSPTVSTVELVG